MIVFYWWHFCRSRGRKTNTSIAQDDHATVSHCTRKRESTVSAHSRALPRNAHLSARVSAVAAIDDVHYPTAFRTEFNPLDNCTRKWCTVTFLCLVIAGGFVGVFPCFWVRSGNGWMVGCLVAWLMVSKQKKCMEWIPHFDGISIFTWLNRHGITIWSFFVFFSFWAAIYSSSLAHGKISYYYRSIILFHRDVYDCATDCGRFLSLSARSSSSLMPPLSSLLLSLAAAVVKRVNIIFYISSTTACRTGASYSSYASQFRVFNKRNTHIIINAEED